MAELEYKGITVTIEPTHRGHFRCTLGGVYRAVPTWNEITAWIDKEVTAAAAARRVSLAVIGLTVDNTLLRATVTGLNRASGGFRLEPKGELHYITADTRRNEERLRRYATAQKEMLAARSDVNAHLLSGGQRHPSAIAAEDYEARLKGLEEAWQRERYAE